jgi:hypothetical protein
MEINFVLFIQMYILVIMLQFFQVPLLEDHHSKELNGLIKEMDKNERRKKKRRKIKNESSSE